MKSAVNINFFWIPAELGGHTHLPWEGMRPRYRSTQFAGENFGDRAVSLKNLMGNSRSGVWKAVLEFDVDFDPRLSATGHQFELLDGFRVIAVGMIIES